MNELKDFKAKFEVLLKESEQIFIVPHNGVDLDAIASAIAVSYIAKKLGKIAYIILDEDPLKIEPGVKAIIDEARKNLSIINLEKYRRMSGENDLLVTCDVNKTYLVSCKNELDSFKNIVVIDHHNEDANTIDTPIKLIRPEKSSASEILTELLLLFQIKIDNFLANYLLAGIYLDTNRFTKNASPNTMKVVSKLTSRGADFNVVNKYFEEDFYTDRRVQELITKCRFYTYTIGVCVGNEDELYLKEDLAKAADYLLKYKLDASFAVGYVEDDTIAISARSKGDINVGEIMGELEGGGNAYSAATKIKGSELEETAKKLEKKIKPKYYIN